MWCLWYLKKKRGRGTWIDWSAVMHSVVVCEVIKVEVEVEKMTGYCRQKMNLY